MAYFANGTEGLLFEDRYCSRCRHGQWETGCPVMELHMLYNYDQHGDDDRAKAVHTVLDTLIPTEGLHPGQCSMFLPVPPRDDPRQPDLFPGE